MEVHKEAYREAYREVVPQMNRKFDLGQGRSRAIRWNQKLNLFPPPSAIQASMLLDIDMI